MLGPHRGFRPPWVPRGGPTAATLLLVLLTVLGALVPAGPSFGPRPAVAPPRAATLLPAPTALRIPASLAPGPHFRSSGLTVKGNFMPWLCQFCTWSGSASAFQTEYQPYHANMTQLSYEMYTLSTSCGSWFCTRGYEGTSNDPTAVARSWGITTLPMITTCTISTLQSFLGTTSNWATFISAALTAAQTYGYGGYNIDWEPDTSCAPGTTTAQDGYHLAHFLDDFSNQSHAKGLVISIDFARWDSSFWNLPVLAATTGDLFMDMNYECPGSTFTNYLGGDTSIFPLAHLGEGLDPESGCTDAQMVQLLGQVLSAGVTNAEWWALDDAAAALDNAHLWTAVHDFVYSGANNGSVSQTYSGAAWGLATNERPTAQGADLRLFTLGTDQQGYGDAALAAGAPISSVTFTEEVSMSPGLYRIYEGNYSSSNATIVSSWTLPIQNGTFSLGPPSKGPADAVFFELASAPGGTVGGYQVGAPGTFAFFQVQVNGGSAGPLTPTATASPSSGGAPLSVGLTGAVSGGVGPYHYWWNLGDGTPHASTQNATHTYAAVGTYMATLTVNDSAGHTAMASVSVVVGLPSISVAATGTPLYGVSPLQVSFSSQATGGTGSFTSYLWSFGDGASSGSPDPVHIYNSTTPATFSARVLVTDSSGASGSSPTLTVHVNESSLAVDASASPRSGGAPLTVRFSAQPTGGSGAYSAFAWTFGDGSTSSVQDPVHVYASVGTFSASVTVTDTLGNVAPSAPVPISVLAPSLGVVFGQVLNASSGAPLTGATVAILLASSGGMLTSIITGPNGSFRAALSPATYLFNASAAGFGTAQQVVTLTAGSSLELNLSLSKVTPRPPGGGHGGNANGLGTLADPLTWLLLAVVGVVLTALLLGLILRRKDRRRPPLGSDSGGGTPPWVAEDTGAGAPAYVHAPGAPDRGQS